jgi:hypothetical protein
MPPQPAVPAIARWLCANPADDVADYTTFVTLEPFKKLSKVNACDFGDTDYRFRLIVRHSPAGSPDPAGVIY